MVIVLTSFTIVTVLVAWYWITMKKSFREGLKLGAGYIVTWQCLTLASLLGLIGTSYHTYLETRVFYSATVEQYATAIEMYEDKAVIDIEAAAWTDLKYQGYQANIASFIKDLREKINNYNTMIISKRVMETNPLFNWLIIAPDDDMKIIKMRTANQHVK